MKTSSQERTKIENLLRDLENSIHNLQESVRESVFRKDYIEADEKQRELLRLKQFYHDKTEELWKLDSADLESSSKQAYSRKTQAIEQIFKRKMELLENHVKLVKAELKRRQGDEFLCKQQEFELVKPHLISNTPEKASLRKSEHNSAKVKHFESASRYRSVLDQQQMQTIPNQAVNAIWTNERNKLAKKHQDERDQVEERAKKIELKERNTMNKQKALLKERFKMQRFNPSYNGEPKYSFDEKEFLYYVNKGVLRLRRHEMKSSFYRELSKSIDSKSRDSQRNRSPERSTDNSRNSPQNYHKKGIQESSYSDTKSSKGFTNGTGSASSRGYTGSNIIDWKDAVFVVPKNSRPTYLKKHIYPVEPSPMFSPEQSNRPRESSKDRAKGVIREFDRSTSRSPGRSSGIRDSHRAESGHLGKSGARQLSSNNLSAKSGKESDKKKVKSSKRSQDNTESLIDIDFEEEDEIDPNVIEIAANTDTQETKVLHKVEPAFEVRDVLKALKGLILTKKPQESAQTPAAPAPRTEPAFETRDVLKAFSGLLQAKAPQVQKVDIVKIPAPKTEPAFETRDVLRALSGLIKPKATSHAPTEAQQAPPKIEPAFETRDVLRALSGLLKPKAPVQAQTDPSPAPPKIEPAFETRDVLKALGSLLKPKTVNHQNESEAVQSAPKIEPAFETRDVLRALSSLLKPKGPVPQSSTEPVHQAPKTEPAFETREVLKALHSLLKPKIPTDTAGLLPPGAQSFPVVIQRVNIAKVETSQP